MEGVRSQYAKRGREQSRKRAAQQTPTRLARKRGTCRRFAVCAPLRLALAMLVFRRSQVVATHSVRRSRGADPSMTAPVFDVVIVGGGIAGSTLGGVLDRGGLHVLVVE